MMDAHFYSFQFYVKKKKSYEQVYVFLSEGHACALDHMVCVVKERSVW